jgi:hypothetical protein
MSLFVPQAKMPHKAAKVTKNSAGRGRLGTTNHTNDPGIAAAAKPVLAKTPRTPRRKTNKVDGRSGKG